MTFRLAALLVAPFVLAANSLPQPAPWTDTIPAARDVDYPGTMTLRVDATDTRRGILRVGETIPVTGPGPMTLLMPDWLPGKHADGGEVEKLAGLFIRAGGRVVPWTRDPIDVHAFHIDVPAGAAALDVAFDFVSSTDGDQGRISVTDNIVNLQWEQVSLYPAGWFTRRIPVSASATWPAGWRAATALRPVATDGDTVRYATVSYEVLQDSPVFAGRFFRAEDLGQGVTLDIVADDAKDLAAPPALLQHHRNLVDQAVKLFGARHFDHYDFLLAISDELGGIGREHHRSSENQVEPGYFLDWDASLPDHNLLPHEFAHSWNGKFRRGADSWQPDFRTPMRNSLLWVYEGQTQFWGYVLEARSGLASKQDVLDGLASIAANLDNRPGRAWRPLADTTNDPVITPRRPKGWVSWQRSEDYYNEGLLIWLEADAIIRAGTDFRRGMDDFARGFFGVNDGDWGDLTYTRADVIAALNAVMPYDWAGFFAERVDAVNPSAPLGGLARAGYRLAYDDKPSNFTRRAMVAGKYLDLFYSLGINVAKGKVAQVLWNSPAFAAGLTVGTEIVAVGGAVYSDDAIKAAITAAKGKGAPIALTVRKRDAVRTVNLQWNGGLRYPRLVRTGGSVSSLDRLLEPR